MHRTSGTKNVLQRSYMDNKHCYQTCLGNSVSPSKQEPCFSHKVKDLMTVAFQKRGRIFSEALLSQRIPFMMVSFN